MLIGALVPAWAEEASNPSAAALIEALLENCERRFRGFLPPGTPPEQIVGIVKSLLKLPD
jgi:hypothetical protein